MLAERTIAGLHAWLLPRVRALPGVSDDSRVLDLGCGSGAWLYRLRTAGFTHLSGIDRHPPAPAEGFHFVEGDIDTLSHAELPMFNLITAIEVIEHVANPEALVALAAAHLEPHGWLVITSPNIYSLRARLRFLLTGKLWFFEHNFHDEHVHPLVLDAFKRVILPRYPLSLQRLVTYPEDRSTGPRLSSHLAERILAPILGNALPGDLLCLFLQRH